MDRERFDAVARVLAKTGSRRTALGALLGAGLLGHGLDAEARKGKDRNKRRGGNDKGRAKRRERERGLRAEQVPSRCFNNTTCTPGPGKNLGKCDFGGSSTLQNKDLSGANLGKANLANANASGANFKGANLGGACLVEANLTNATFGNSTNISTAVICRTIMPDGTTSNATCHLGTVCCPTCDDENPCPPGELCCGGRCRVRVPVILSGGPDPATTIFVDDEVEVFLNGNSIAQGTFPQAGPFSFSARLGDELHVVATDILPICHGLGPLFLHSEVCGRSQILDATGVPQTCPNVAVGVFF
ncbi:MAG: pentapeptide repeat-containing protein, partial [Thermomicrobiales bacterium]